MEAGQCVMALFRGGGPHLRRLYLPDWFERADGCTVDEREMDEVKVGNGR